MDTGWIGTYNRHKVNPLSISQDDVDIVDIAHSLSNICRFNGHCNRFYSVAEHCVIGTRELKKYMGSHGYNDYEIIPYQKQFLLHDASETYLCDVPRPIKPNLTNYKKIEEIVESVIFAKFNLPYPFASEIKDMDNIMLANESKLLFDDISDWNIDNKWVIPQNQFNFYSPEKIKSVFLETYINLFKI